MDGSFVKLFREVLRRRDIGASAKLVHAFLENYKRMNPDENPTIREIAAGCGCGKNVASRAVRELTAKGLIETVTPGINPRKQPTTYRMCSVPEKGTEPVPEKGTETDRRTQNRDGAVPERGTAPSRHPGHIERKEKEAAAALLTFGFEEKEAAKLVRRYGADQALGLCRRARAEAPADPRRWIASGCREGWSVAAPAVVQPAVPENPAVKKAAVERKIRGWAINEWEAVEPDERRRLTAQAGGDPERAAIARYREKHGMNGRPNA